MCYAVPFGQATGACAAAILLANRVESRLLPDGFAGVVPDVAGQGIAEVAGIEVGEGSPDAAFGEDSARDAVVGDVDIGGFPGAAIEGITATADEVVADC